MDFKDCIEFANKNPICYLATVEGDQPRVRAFGMWFADAQGFYFHTGAPKAVCRQLKENQKVEVCFYAPAPPPNLGKMMRVAGEVQNRITLRWLYSAYTRVKHISGRWKRT